MLRAIEGHPTRGNLDSDRFPVIVILDSHAEVTVGWLESWPAWSNICFSARISRSKAEFQVDMPMSARFPCFAC